MKFLFARNTPKFKTENHFFVFQKDMYYVIMSYFDKYLIYVTDFYK